MPTLEGLDPQLQTVGTLVFVVAVGLLAAWSAVFGRKAPKQETKEFAVAGQLADMGPVRELVEGQGLLYQQAIRTNVALERLATAIEGQIAEQRAEQEIEDEVERRLAVRDSEMGPRRPRKPPA